MDVNATCESARKLWADCQGSLSDLFVNLFGDTGEEALRTIGQAAMFCFYNKYYEQKTYVIKWMFAVKVAALIGKDYLPPRVRGHAQIAYDKLNAALGIMTSGMGI